MHTGKVTIIPVENCGLSLLDSQVSILVEIWLWNPCKTYYGQEEKEVQIWRGVRCLHLCGLWGG